MPVMHGLDLVRSLRLRQVTVPIVMVSGYATVEQQCLAAEANLFCLKPVNINRLTSELIHLLPPTGTGIGLAIVRKAIERLGGQVWAESTPGAGATFYLEIPYDDRSDQAADLAGQR